MTHEHWILLVFVTLLLLDCIAYFVVITATQPTNIQYSLPGSGFVAYWKYRRDKLSAKNAKENVDEND